MPLRFLVLMLLAPVLSWSASGSQANPFLALLDSDVIVQDPDPRLQEPDENGPLEALITFWVYRRTPERAPSEFVKQRLLDAGVNGDVDITDVLGFCTDSPWAQERIYAHWDSISNCEEDGSLRTKDRLKEWLMQYSGYFRDELVDKARMAFSLEEGSLAGHLDTLEILIRKDWPVAKSILLRMEGDSHPVRQILALRLHHLHDLESGAFPDPRRLARMKLLSGNSQIPVKFRVDALAAILPESWDGWEEWFLAILEEKTLRRAFSSHIGQPWPAIGIAKDPERWATFLIRLLSSPDPELRDIGISGLVQIQPQEMRAEWLRPLLPWLVDPRWSNLPSRNQFLECLQRVEVPEAIPFAISLLADTTNLGNQVTACRILARNADASCIAPLQAALYQIQWSPIRRLVLGDCITRALVKSGGLSVDQCVDHIQQALEWQASFDSINPKERPVPVIPAEVVIGKSLMSFEESCIPLAAGLVKRSRQLDETHPAQAESLRTLLWKWPTPQGDQELVRRITECPLHLSDLKAALQQRQRLLENHHTELDTLSQGGGRRAAFVTALLGDSKRALEILQWGSIEDQFALVVSARACRMPLPHGKVALLSLRSPDLVRAADSYLRAAPTRIQVSW